MLAGVKRYFALALTMLLAAAMPASQGSAAAALDDLAERYWQHQLQTDYLLRSQVGLAVETISPVTVDEANREALFAQSVLDGLKAIDPAALDHDRWLTYRTLSFLAANLATAPRFFWLVQQATPYAGGGQLGAITTLLTTYQLQDPTDARRYVSLLHQYAAFVRSLRAFLQGQHDRGIILPDAESSAAQAVFRAYAQAAQTSALVPVPQRLGALSPADRSALVAQSNDAVSSELLPAFQSVADYLNGAYRAGAPTGVGLSQYPGGRAYYEHLIFANTTLTITPERLHELGISEVTRLNAALDEIRRAMGFTGSLAAFKQFLAHDPQFFATTTEGFGSRLELYVGRARAATPRFFNRMPTAPYGVAPLPEALAGSQTFGYYDQPTAAKPKAFTSTTRGIRNERRRSAPER
jgi:uncharacterized protein (DUF885 family)